MQQAPRAQIVFAHLHRACGFARFQRHLRQGQQTVLIDQLFIAALDLARQARTAPFDRFQIGQHQFGFNRLGIGHGVNAAFDMGDIAVFKAAQHMGNGVAFADIGQKLVAQALAFRCTPHQPRDVDKGHASRNNLLGPCNCRQFIQPCIGHSHFAHVGFNRAKRKVCRLRRCRSGQGVEKGGFSHIRQTHDTHFETHDTLRFFTLAA